MLRPVVRLFSVPFRLLLVASVTCCPLVCTKATCANPTDTCSGRVLERGACAVGSCTQGLCTHDPCTHVGIHDPCFPDPYSPCHQGPCEDGSCDWCQCICAGAVLAKPDAFLPQLDDSQCCVFEPHEELQGNPFACREYSVPILPTSEPWGRELCLAHNSLLL